MEKKHDSFLRHPVVATVVGGLILAFLLSLIPAIREWARLIFARIVAWSAAAWAWLSGDIALPRVLVGLLIAALALMLFRARLASKTSGEQAEPIAPIGPAAMTPRAAPVAVRYGGVDLGDDEIEILKMLAARDGGSVYFTQIKQELQASRLRAEHAIACLESLGLIEWYAGTHENGRAYLMPSGREICVRQGWAQ